NLVLMNYALIRKSSDFILRLKLILIQRNSCTVLDKSRSYLLLSQVVANAVAALSEISESHPNSNLLDLNPQNINKLLTALNECTEWGQIFILDCLSNYNPKDDREAQRSVSCASGACAPQRERPAYRKKKKNHISQGDGFNMVKNESYRPVLELLISLEKQVISVGALGGRNIKISIESRDRWIRDKITASLLNILLSFAFSNHSPFCYIRYESIIATLCENLDSLDEPDARAAMIWIVGEYAERIDNLLESFLEGFHDESTQVQLTLLTAIVKLFLKKPSETQELVQQILSLATRDSDNPDLRDRGYIYWRLLSTDPVTAKEVVLSEKPLISEETDLIEPTLLDELICHIGSLASVYHKPPNAFVEGSHGIHRKHLPVHHGSTDAGDSPVGTTTATNLEQPQVIPSQGDLLGDLLNLDLGPPVNVPQVSSMQMGAVDLLGGGLDSLLGSDLGGGIGGSPAVGQSFIPSSVPATFAPSPTPAVVSSGLNDLFELSTGIGMAPGGYVAPKAVWLPAVKAKGLEISGTFTHRQGHIYMEMNFTNKALQHMTDFAIQFNKNSFGVIPSTPLAIHTPLMPNQSIDVSLPLNTLGPVMKMEPLNNLQVAVKNNIDVFYFSCLIPLNVLFVEDGKMERQVFLATWKDIPNENELQFQIKECHLNADTVSSKLQNNNVYTIAKRNVEGQDMLYQSLKLTNGIWILAELRIQPGNPNYTLSLKCRAPEVSQYIYQVYDSILKN
uniref:Adaptor related protein complex 2 subunit beta 1 n=1 Tax=Monodon monoceros TaxID=40151 RepID=A0A8C6C6F6_MONMO